MNTPLSQYSQFTPEERLRLTLAAYERGDGVEVERLMSSCPQERRVIPDPRYTGPLICLLGQVREEIIRWMTVSAMIFVCRVVVDDRSAEDVAHRAKVKAGWKTLSTVWRGIEAGISKFCADAGLTYDQLLWLAGGRPAPVEWAGQLLHDHARADDRIAEAVCDRLWQAWQVRSQG